MNYFIFCILFLLVQLTFVSGAQSSFWKDRRQALQQQTIPALKIITPQEEKSNAQILLRESGILLPQNFGKVTEVYLPKKRISPTFVVHIQDAHNVYGAQKNLANMVTLFQKQLKQDEKLLIAIEGAWEELNLDPFYQDSDLEERTKTAEKLLKEGTIHGEEYAALCSQSNNLIISGIEDRELYLANTLARQQVGNHRKIYIQILDHLELRLKRLREKTFNSELTQLWTAHHQYQTGAITLVQYIKKLKSFSDIKLPQQVDLVHNVSLQEESFKKQNTGELVKKLAANLSQTQLQDLTRQTLNYRTKQLSASAYYNYLWQLAPNNKEIAQAAKLFKQAESVKEEPLLQELEDFSKSVQNQSASTKQAKIVLDLSRWIIEEKKFWKEEFSPALWETYSSKNLSNAQVLTANKATIAELEQTYNLESPQLKINFKPDQKILPISQGAQLQKAYYSLAKKRDLAMAEKFNQLLNKHSTRTAIVIAGGFHSQGMMEILKKRGIAYAVIRPSLNASTNNIRSSQKVK